MKTSEKGSEKTSEKIIQIIKFNPRISAKDIGVILSITSRAVEMQLSKLKSGREDKKNGS